MVTTLWIRGLLVLLAGGLIAGCHTTKPSDEEVTWLASPSGQVANAGEILVSLTPEADIEQLRQAWAVFNPTLTWLGPPQQRLLKVVVVTEFGLDQVLANISATQGVAAAQLNYLRQPFDPE